jgi:cytochrome c oxidase cbb3-type subunit III
LEALRLQGRALPVLFAVLGICFAAPFSPHAKAQGAAAQGQGQRIIAYPDRPKAPQEVLDRGKAQFGVTCAFCHGSDAGGGEGGPNLLRSDVVLQDQSGELISPIVHGARVDKGMPRIDITDAQISDIAAWLHSLHVASRTTPDETINIVTGDAGAGQAAFQKRCATCHSVTGDLQGFALKAPTPKALQQAWLLPPSGSSAPRGGAGAGAQVTGLHVPPVTVTVTLPTGEKVTGKLGRIDDFYVGLTKDDGTNVGFARSGDVPKVEIHDPLAAHRELLRSYSDKEIHDITAYLVTLK